VFAVNAYDAMYVLAIAMAVADRPDSGERLKETIWNSQPGKGVKQLHSGQWAQILAELQKTGRGRTTRARPGDINFDASGDVFSDIAEWTVRAGGWRMATTTAGPRRASNA